MNKRYLPGQFIKYRHRLGDDATFNKYGKILRTETYVDEDYGKLHVVNAGKFSWLYTDTHVIEVLDIDETQFNLLYSV